MIKVIVIKSIRRSYGYSLQWNEGEQIAQDAEIAIRKAEGK